MKLGFIFMLCYGMGWVLYKSSFLAMAMYVAIVGVLWLGPRCFDSII